MITRYATNNLGEAEIGAWELGSGCWTYRAAWVLNTLSLMLGLFKNPARVFRAFVRGRQTTNLYGRDPKALLARDVDDVRKEMGMDEPQRTATLMDVAWFAVHLTTSLALTGVFLVLIGWVLIRLILALRGLLV